MNKYQEAIKRVELDFEDRVEEDNILMVGRMDIEILQELVDRATPMKPFLLVEHKNPKKRRYQCPRCGNACLVRYAPFERNENRHCYHCGQKIDWSEDE